MDASSLRVIFNKFDKNGDGKISASELTAVINSMTSSAVAIPENQSFSFEEFEALFNKKDDEEEDESLRDAFELYDEDGNGLISAKELHGMMKKLEMECSLEECERMIKGVDEDGDGFVSFHEFKRMMKGGNAS